MDRCQAVHFGSDADPVEHLACPDEDQDVEGADHDVGPAGDPESELHTGFVPVRLPRHRALGANRGDVRPTRRARRQLCQLKIPAEPMTVPITQAPPCAKMDSCTARSAAAIPRPAASAPSASSRQTKRCRPARTAANGTAEVAAR